MNLLASILVFPWVFITAEPTGLFKGLLRGTVNTTSGVIIGHPSTNRTSVLEYLGIPYAQPPISNLRFEPPVTFNSTAIYNASNYSVDCPYNPSSPVAYPNKSANFDRIFGIFTGQEDRPQGEDCLTLNIWSKSGGNKSKAVLLWLYGGRFTIGASNNLFYQGQYMADYEDVVVVTIKQVYRINIFGFSGAPGLTQNVGLLDQRLAIEWVRDNIAGFGGNPSKITIFGQSAGGVSVDYYAYSWKSDPIVAGLISHSGTAASFAANTQATNTAHFYNTSNILGCGSTGNVLECMRSQNFSSILAAIAKVPVESTGARTPPAFQPTVDNITVFSNYTELAKGGSFAKLPYLAGNCDNEAGFYKIGAFAQGSNLTAAQWNIFGLESFTCATGIETAYRVNYNIPTWRYRYFGDWPNLRLYPGSGAYHGSDIEMVLGTAYDVSQTPSTISEEITSRYMMKAWAAFAKDPARGLEEYGWPMYANTSGNTLVRLGYDNESTASFVSPHVYDALCWTLNGSVSGGIGAF